MIDVAVRRREVMGELGKILPPRLRLFGTDRLRRLGGRTSRDERDRRRGE
jgi:hypothetical protein